MTTFRALANPAFVAVTETVTFSPWTSASFDTVCCCCYYYNYYYYYAQREKEDESQKSRRQRAEEVMTLASSVVEFDRGTDDKEKTRVDESRTCCTKMCAFSDANAKDAMTVDAKTPKSTVFTTGDDDTKTLVVV